MKICPVNLRVWGRSLPGSCCKPEFTCHWMVSMTDECLICCIRNWNTIVCLLDTWKEWASSWRLSCCLKKPKFALSQALPQPSAFRLQNYFHLLMFLEYIVQEILVFYRAPIQYKDARLVRSLAGDDSVGCMADGTWTTEGSLCFSN